MAIINTPVSSGNVNLKDDTPSSLTASSRTSTSGREYPVGLDADENLSVNVPWLDITKARVDSALGAGSGSLFYRQDGKWASPATGGITVNTLYFSRYGLNVSSGWNRTYVSAVSWSTYALLFIHIAMLHPAGSSGYTNYETKGIWYPNPSITIPLFNGFKTEYDYYFYPLRRNVPEGSYSSHNHPFECLNLISSGWDTLGFYDEGSTTIKLLGIYGIK